MGYHQLELEPKPREITTLDTHSGLHSYKRLLFGVNSASEVFQCKIASALAGIEGATNISDTIVVHAADKETLDKRLRQVLETMKAVNESGTKLGEVQIWPYRTGIIRIPGIRKGHRPNRRTCESDGLSQIAREHA